MSVNTTTPHMSPLDPSASAGPWLSYILLPLVGFAAIGGLAVLVLYLRRRKRLDELRHKLIPLFSYDHSEQEWGDEGDWDNVDGNEEKELAEPLIEGKLSLTSGYYEQ